MKTIACLSTPSSGTDWFCRLVAKYADARYFDKEWFNPICNREREKELSLGFGCELYPYVGNIARCNPELMEPAYGAWLESGFTFTKEVWSPTKGAWFMQRFENVFALYREPHYTFPPRRLRVWAWYDCIYAAAVQAKALLPLTSDRDDMATRASRAHAWAWGQITASGVTVIDYSKLMRFDEEQLREYLSAMGFTAFCGDLQALSKEISATRWQGWDSNRV